MKEVNLKTKIIKNIHTSIHTQPYTTLKQRKRNFTKMCRNFSFDFLQQILAYNTNSSRAPIFAKTNFAINKKS